MANSRPTGGSRFVSKERAQKAKNVIGQMFGGTWNFRGRNDDNLSTSHAFDSRQSNHYRRFLCSQTFLRSPIGNVSKARRSSLLPHPMVRFLPSPPSPTMGSSSARV
jgi:hypothetical protein